MVVGMLLAGGVGQRMGASVPKQFLEVGGKPIILYPLEIMEKHPLVDAIEIVCVESFIPEMKKIVEAAGLSKVKWIVSGGASAQESTRNGIMALKDKMDEQDILMIHMSSYPLANEEIMTSCIESAIKNGNGCTARPILYSVFFTDDKHTTTEQIDRDKLMLCTIPYAFNFGEVLDLYERAFAEGKGVEGNVFTNTLYCDYGKTIYFTKDSETNMKVTTAEDLKLMEAYLGVMKEEEVVK
jgi:2-C-methyl-D-erythritol 4-phosphate cytidylyltransferase